ncbi:DNA adenine methylase [Limimaricola variabilis]|uniref:DNA adenine methylase n=1 Tax=Limimaricola variabilis TaxID=1492771 RepID=UPI002AC95E81|nr:DNA adenine methylase [Limimaricola variabilis]WPY95632.1 DNA adenine methylase [Limimaricola variabilis]
MKYMGSKRTMLCNGLGDALNHALAKSERVLDLFTGSAAVSWHVAELYEKEVLATDLQMYSTVLAASVIERTRPIIERDWVDMWFERAMVHLHAHSYWLDAKALQESLTNYSPIDAAFAARSFHFGSDFCLSKAYGGYYFSPWQAMWLDALRVTLPPTDSYKKVALAALIQAASRCAASPGHTAQPFKANETAGRYLIKSWQRDLPEIVRERIEDIAPRFSLKKGVAFCQDALELAQKAQPGDLVFLDPPYSGVHYSRFYHVLESVARGRVGEVFGAGRYPEISERPSSEFSVRRTSKKALNDLLKILSERDAEVLITFPAGKASNGLSGEDVKIIAADHFEIEEEKVSSRFSTMGGNLRHRAARQEADELILKLTQPL